MLYFLLSEIKVAHNITEIVVYKLLKITGNCLFSGYSFFYSYLCRNQILKHIYDI